MSKKHKTDSASNPATIAAAAPAADMAADATATPASAPAAQGARRGSLQDAAAAARKRLEGTRAEKVLKDVAVRAEKELDGFLDRVGLVRKTRVGQPAPTPAPVNSTTPVHSQAA